MPATKDGQSDSRSREANEWSLVFDSRVDHDWILKTYQEKTGDVLDYELEPVEEQSARLAARRSNNVLLTDKFENWMKMLSPDTRKLYYTPHTLPELKKSIELICVHRANLKSSSNQDVTEKRKLLVTGGCGFIGSNFVNHWLRTYPEDYVINVDRLDTCSNIRNIEQADSPNYKLVVASINNKDLMLHLMRQYDITHVVHFAGKICFLIALIFYSNSLSSTNPCGHILWQQYSVHGIEHLRHPLSPGSQSNL